MTTLPTEPVGLPTAPPAHHGTAPSAAAPGGALVADGYDPRLTNEDLAPLRAQRWTSYNIFAFWMSDVHSVGGYVTAGSLFALGIAGWQVLVALLVGIVIVQVFANLVAKPSQKTGRCSASRARTSRPSSAG
jgi:NCS1 family nucleobase:cation symporter-1